MFRLLLMYECDNLFIYLFIYLFIRQDNRVLLLLSVYLFIYLFIYLMPYIIRALFCFHSFLKIQKVYAMETSRS